MDMPLFSPPRTRAFTLVELLTVIAIIGILAAILIPVVGSMRSTARSSGCLANLRQIAAAGQLYANDNQRRLVPISKFSYGMTWRYSLAPYLSLNPDKIDTTQGALACPEDLAQNLPPNSDTAGKRPYSYGVNKSTNLHQYLQSPSNSSTFAAVNRPSRTIFVSDLARVTNPNAAPADWVGDFSATNGSLGYARFPGDNSFTGSDAWNIFPRHRGKANVAFYDGSVRSVNVKTEIIDQPAGTPGCLFTNAN
ncbi:MAG: prepilin-type N-terminal cleavage/methylation domain-containing protein [Opitutaceae bacterium]|nr:prepilin-type N-terminal cleavage/methylation domain-containing protein [Opitutaceae bacterium]